MTGELVQYEVDGGVAILTLNNPPANAYSYEMMRALDEAVLRARFDDAVHVLVLTGAGDRFFCAGADIAMLSRAQPSFKYNFCLHANETLLRLEHTPKLCIAMINGHCVGGGLEIALAADLRLAPRGAAFKIGLPEVALGVLPGTGGTQRLARLVGKSRAIELMARGTNLGVQEALEAGLLTELVDTSSRPFREMVLEYARSFCPPARASLAVGRIKRAVQTGWEIPLESGLALERELQQQLFLSEDAREGLTAYLEKRSPRFSGR
ncbi:MAG: enoyl-CoA hydratase/isomerase family protein [Myxococcales bacterium]|nr:enoyl-CoA hydratase/isomerase family protein [Myxococcota bacterium]MDW8281314.1 enoyl-CoA hydratase/isomerase family protein [Myxococcales bacterium]